MRLDEDNTSNKPKNIEVDHEANMREAMLGQ